jgi:hypothetical protein
MAHAISFAASVRSRVEYRLRKRKLARRSFRVVRLYDYFCKAFNPGSDFLDIRSHLFSSLLATGNHELMSLPEDWWNKYIQLILCEQSAHEAFEQELLEMTRQEPIQTLTAPSWHDLFRICMFSGLFCIGQTVRDKAFEAYCVAPVDTLSDQTALKRALSQFLEKGDQAGALNVLDRLAEMGVAKNMLDQGHWFCDLLCSGKLRAALPATKSGSAESAMLKAVSGQTVAIVGPVPSSTPNGEEIDKYNLVVKFNYRGGDQGCDPETQGKRVDVSYYNVDQAKYISRTSEMKKLGNLKFPVFIKEQGFRRAGNNFPSGRVIDNAQWLLFDSEFHAGTNAALDIFRFAPQKVTIFNSDLMLTAGRYKGYWRPGTKEVNYCLSFAKTHDPIMQFNYLHSLWSKGFLSGDGRFSEIMKNGRDDYILNLQKAHGIDGKSALLML